MLWRELKGTCSMDCVEMLHRAVTIVVAAVKRGAHLGLELHQPGLKGPPGTCVTLDRKPNDWGKRSNRCASEHSSCSAIPGYESAEQSDEAQNAEHCQQLHQILP